MALVKFKRPRTLASYVPSGFPLVSAFPTFDDMENRVGQFINRVFDEPFTPVLPESIGWLPAMEIVEGEKELKLSAELPGLEEKNIDVTVDEGVLTIRGEKLEEKKEEKEDKKFYLYERSYGTFERSFALPTTIDAAKIEAKFEKGVLTVTMPKVAEAKPKALKVAVKTG